MIAPLKQRSFLMLYIAQFFSDMGNWFDIITLSVIITYHWKMGAGAMAALTITFGFPWVVLGPILSVYADRLPKRILMLSCHLLRVLVVIGLIFAPNIYILLILVLLKETIGAAYDPAHQGAIKILVPEQLIPEASSLSQLSVNTCKIIAPALGGLLISISGPKTTFIIEAVGFLISAAFIFWLSALNVVTAEQNEAGKYNSFWSELKKGFSCINASRVLKIAISLSSARLFLIYLYDGILVIWAKSLGFSESIFSFLISSIGLGSVLGSLIAGQWKRWGTKPIATMCIASTISGVLVVLIGLIGYGIWYVNTYILISIFLQLGIIGSVIPITYGYIIQSETSPELVGRVVGTANSIQNFFMLSAPAIGAFLAELMGVNIVFTIAGSCISLLGASILLVSRGSTKMALSNEQVKTEQL